MGVSAAVFESAGRRTEHYVPGVYSRSNNVSSSSGVSAGNLCILGKSAGGKPFTLMEFGSIADAKETLVSGELLNAVGYAFNGSTEYVPQRVFAMRVNSATQSNITLQSGSVDVLKLKSWDYGNHTNQLKVKVDTGSTVGSKKITVAYKENSFVLDNLIQESLQIVGQGENPTVTIDATSITLQTTDDEEVITEKFLFDDYSTVASLVSRINDTDYFIAIMKDTDEEALSKNLDTITAKSISENQILYSNFYAIVKNLLSVPYISEVEILSESSRIVPDNVSYSYFVGGSDGSYTTDEWTKALEILETQDIQIIATPSINAEIHSLISNHCTQMSSTVNRKERTALLGSPIDESDDDAIQKARNLNSSLVSYVIDSAMASNPLTGKTEKISGAILAIMLAGMESSMSVHIPLTNKTLKVFGFSKIRSITNMEKLIKNGVLVCNPSPDDATNFVCIRALTTYQKNDLIQNERSMMREAMYMDRDLRNRFASAIGTPSIKGTSEYLSTLDMAAKEWKLSGYIVMNDNGENVWNKNCVIDGDKVKLTYSRYLTAPTNFIFITANNYVYTSTVEI